MNSPVILWFRQDLRLENNPALTYAISLKRPIITLYIDDTQDPLPAGSSARWWLHHSLISLEKSLGKYSIPLILRQGSCLNILKQLVKETGAEILVWNDIYRQYCCERDTHIKKNLENENLEISSFQGNFFIQPWQLVNKTKTPYKVYTPFCNALIKTVSDIKLSKLPKNVLGYEGKIDSDDLNSWNLLSKEQNNQLSTYWKPGEQHAQKSWKYFLNKVDDYHKLRNLPAIEGISKLSPYLHWGEISVQQLWKDIETHQFSNHLSEGIDIKTTSGASVYSKELIWRDFFQYLLYHFPEMKDQPLQKKFEKIVWKKPNQEILDKWKNGLTGYPIVDAGMRQLLTIGWMHNRVRLITASFLIKHLRIDWQVGEQWFWENLVDADHGSNIGNWQWVAGCGADAAPYFRIFNPVLQSQKFDPEGLYIKQWVSELKNLPKMYIHQPWKAPQNILNKANIILDKTYPLPMVDHEQAREQALNMYSILKNNNVDK